MTYPFNATEIWAVRYYLAKNYDEESIAEHMNIPLRRVRRIIKEAERKGEI